MLCEGKQNNNNEKKTGKKSLSVGGKSVHLLSVEVGALKSPLSAGEGWMSCLESVFPSLYNVRNSRTAVCIAMQGFFGVRAHQGIEKGLMCSH